MLGIVRVGHEQGEDVHISGIHRIEEYDLMNFVLIAEINDDLTSKRSRQIASKGCH